MPSPVCENFLKKTRQVLIVIYWHSLQYVPITWFISFYRAVNWLHQNKKTKNGEFNFPWESTMLTVWYPNEMRANSRLLCIQTSWLAPIPNIETHYDSFRFTGTAIMTGKDRLGGNQWRLLTWLMAQFDIKLMLCYSKLATHHPPLTPVSIIYHTKSHHMLLTHCMRKILMYILKSFSRIY